MARYGINMLDVREIGILALVIVPGVRCLPRNERMDRTPIPRIRANARN